MIDSFRSEESHPIPELLQEGHVKISFDDPKKTPIILETATARTVVYANRYGQYEYDELKLANGLVLSPSDLSPDHRIATFTKDFDAVVEFGNGALLRTAMHRRDMKFLEVVAMDTTRPERKVIEQDIMEVEKARLPIVLQQQRQFFDDFEDHDLYLRLEAVHDPDKALVGAIVMARLACFIAHRAQIGFSPLIFTATRNNVTTVIPEQLTVNENWLYSEFRLK